VAHANASWKVSKRALLQEFPDLRAQRHDANRPVIKF